MEKDFNRFPDEILAYQGKRRQHWNAIAEKSRFTSTGEYYKKLLLKSYRHQVSEGLDVLELGCGSGDLLAGLKPRHGLGIDLSPAMVQRARERHADLTHLQFTVADIHEDLELSRQYDVIILSDLIGDLWDLQKVLQNIKGACKPSTRLFFNFYSRLWGVPLFIAQRMNLANRTLPQNWFTQHDLINLLELSEYEPLRTWEEILLPFKLPYISGLTNRVLAKIAPFRWLALANFLVARPSRSSATPASVSVIVPARNESGHIRELIARIPKLGSRTEVIFVEGHSSDNTWAEILAATQNSLAHEYKNIKQPGRGKGDAVRHGFREATGDILMILDADITVPPEDLPRFYDVLSSGKGEFVNGVRLVYPMQEDAMRPLNLLGNKAFSFLFTWLLGQPIRDTLCGTKAMWRTDYHRLANDRKYFGDFDPFGDFDLLFGAAKLNLKITEIPVRYRARTYGETNIQRWRHGLLLLRMVLVAARRLKFV